MNPLRIVSLARENSHFRKFLKTSRVGNKPFSNVLNVVSSEITPNVARPPTVSREELEVPCAIAVGLETISRRFVLSFWK